MTVIGIDPSVKAPAFAVWPARATHRIAPLPGNGSDRLCALYGATKAWAQANTPDDLQAVFCEAPFGRYEKKALDQAVGVITVAMIHGLQHRYPYPVTVFPIATGTWKKLALGNGAAKKGAVMDWATANATQTYGMTQDEADALAVACAGASLLAHGKETP